MPNQSQPRKSFPKASVFVQSHSVEEEACNLNVHGPGEPLSCILIERPGGLIWMQSWWPSGHQSDGLTVTLSATLLLRYRRTFLKRLHHGVLELLTPCQHTFHCHWLSRWLHNFCPFFRSANNTPKQYPAIFLPATATDSIRFHQNQQNSPSPGDVENSVFWFPVLKS